MYDAVTRTLTEAAASGARVRVRGGGTKLGWGTSAPAPDVEIDMRPYDGILEHNVGDLTAIVQAGVPMARLREVLAAEGQMLAIDPPPVDGVTIGGTIATGDSGPLRHRYGAPRDLVLGMTIALGDGTLARTGGKVIKNVAGYDLAKLFTGSFGTLGAILDVAVRLHPLPPLTVTAVGESDDAERLAAAASELAHSSIEAHCLDLRWNARRGVVLARLAGTEAAAQADEAAAVLARMGVEGWCTEDDEWVWNEQRGAQRAPDGTVVRVAGTQSQLAAQMRAAESAGGSLVARVAHGLGWIALPNGTDPGGVERLRRELAPSPCVVLDGAGGAADVWGVPAEAPAVELMRRVKARFDPARVCNPGVFVGGI